MNAAVVWNWSFSALLHSCKSGRGCLRSIFPSSHTASSGRQEARPERLAGCAIRRGSSHSHSPLYKCFMARIWLLEWSDSAKCTASALQSDAVSKRASDEWGKSGSCANVFAFLIEDRETTMHSLAVDGGFSNTCNQSTCRPLLVREQVCSESALGFTKAGGFSCSQTHTYSAHQPLNRST